MTSSNPYRLLGGPGSPYSLKMRALLRYRRLPHHWIVPNSYLGTEGELKRAGKKIIPVLQDPQGSYWADSTPLAYELERRHPAERSILPTDPAQAFLSLLVEDMADELMCLMMFEQRWGSEKDLQFCARRQLSGWLSPMPKDAFETHVSNFITRQTRIRGKLAGASQHVLLHAIFPEIIGALEHMLETSLFLFGSRPSLADFGLYGQLSQCAIDPSMSEQFKQLAPRAFQWVQTMDDASGIDGHWSTDLQSSPWLLSLLRVAGEIHLPLLVAQVQALQAGQGDFSVQVRGHTWQAKVDPYKLKCLAWLRQAWAALPAASQEQLTPMLQETACWHALQADALDLSSAGEMRPF